MLRLENRTGRVIALGRLTLALFILAAVAFGARDMAGEPGFAVPVGLLYVAIAAVMLAMTWSDWWLEHRLKLPSHLVDIAFFFAIDLSQGLTVASPFFPFFVFLVLAAAAKWGMRGVVLTAVVVTLLYGVATALEGSAPTLSDEDQARVIVRAGHLLVLSLMIGWFGIARLGGQPGVQDFADLRSLEPPVRQAIEHMSECLEARTVGLVWSDPDEPWFNLAVGSAAGDFRLERAPPEQFSWLAAAALDAGPFLFDIANRRALALDGRRLRASRRVEPVNPALARRLGLESGLAAPFSAEGFDGWFIAGGIDGLTGDDLPVARKVALDIGRAFDRSAALRAIAETTGSETRLRVARDIHDSLAQILAGIGLKLRAARSNASDEAQRDRELREIEAELVRYQEYILDFIRGLRRPEASAGRVDLNARLAALAASLARQWDVEVDYRSDGLASVSAPLEAEIELFLREAVANSVRHGGATRIALGAELDGDDVVLSCRDNGDGFPRHGDFEDAALQASGMGPRSIQERAHLLGGSVALVSGEDGTMVTISLPTRSPLS